MLFFTFFVGLCAVSAYAEEVNTDTLLTIYGYDKDSQVAFLPLKIKQSLDESKPFVLQFENFTDNEIDYFNSSFVLVYRPTEDADHLESYFIRNGLRTLFSLDKPESFNSLGALQKYLLSEEHYGFTPKMAHVFLQQELFQLPITKLYTDHITVKTYIYLYSETPFLYVFPKTRLEPSWMSRDAYPLGRYSISAQGVSPVSHD